MVVSPFLPLGCSPERTAWRDGLEAATERRETLEYVRGL
jgi:hypothetical protein